MSDPFEKADDPAPEAEPEDEPDAPDELPVAKLDADLVEGSEPETSDEPADDQPAERA